MRSECTEYTSRSDCRWTNTTWSVLTELLFLAGEFHLNVDGGRVVIKRRPAAVQAFIPLREPGLEDHRITLHLGKCAIAPVRQVTLSWICLRRSILYFSHSEQITHKDIIQRYMSQCFKLCLQLICSNTLDMDVGVCAIIWSSICLLTCLSSTSLFFLKSYSNT